MVCFDRKLGRSDHRQLSGVTASQHLAAATSADVETNEADEHLSVDWNSSLPMMGKKRWLRFGVLAAMALGAWCLLNPVASPQEAPVPQISSALPPALPKREYTLLFTGDIMLSRAVG